MTLRSERRARTRFLAPLVTLASFVAAFAGCRCDNGRAGVDAGAQPTMPTGMLAPAPSGAADADVVLSGPMRLQAYATRPTTGDWVTVRVDSEREARSDGGNLRGFGGGAAKGGDGDVASVRYVTVDTMTLLHEPFARAMPGFDLFVPRLFQGEALAKLRSELGSFKQEWIAVGASLSAKTKWAKTSTLVASLKSDDEWLTIRAALASTIDAILQVVDHVEKNNRRLLVQGS